MQVLVEGAFTINFESIELRSDNAQNTRPTPIKWSVQAPPDQPWMSVWTPNHWSSKDLRYDIWAFVPVSQMMML